tara:strand:- start:2655 stop:2876 length:222 start_codon:yes stop_codon:yes gene_type:complete
MAKLNSEYINSDRFPMDTDISVLDLDDYDYDFDEEEDYSLDRSGTFDSEESISLEEYFALHKLGYYWPIKGER